MNDAHRGLVAAIVVLLVGCCGGFSLMLAGGMGGGTAGSLLAGAGLACMAGGTLTWVGAAAARYRETTNPRVVWLFRLAAAAWLLAAVLVFFSFALSV
jgi:hypothetical protein